MASEGLYIVIEGHDGTGKSTQVKLLRERLLKERNIDSIEFHEPAGTPIADAVRDILKDGSLKRTPKTNMLLFNAIRCEIWQECALPALKSGKFVVASRNWWSTVAYQGYGEGVDLELIKNNALTATDQRYMKPDIGVILTVKSEIERKKRISNRGELNKPDTFESRDAAFQCRVGNGYNNIIHKYDLPTIDASQSIDKIADIIWSIVETKIKTV